MNPTSEGCAAEGASRHVREAVQRCRDDYAQERGIPTRAGSRSLRPAMGTSHRAPTRLSAPTGYQAMSARLGWPRFEPPSRRG
jgi:hypothetical protein